MHGLTLSEISRGRINGPSLSSSLDLFLSSQSYRSDVSSRGKQASCYVLRLFIVKLRITYIAISCTFYSPHSFADRQLARYTASKPISFLVLCSHDPILRRWLSLLPSTAVSDVSRLCRLMISNRIRGTKLVFGPMIINILLDGATAETRDPGPHGPDYTRLSP